MKPNDNSALLNILLASILLSQILSNVPFVTLYLPLMKQLGFGTDNVSSWIALAAGSTIAGNLTLLGAASNLIIVENAESRGYKLGFIEFVKVGSIVTLLNSIIIFASLIIFDLII